jgi:hypothetical protein
MQHSLLVSSLKSSSVIVMRGSDETTLESVGGGPTGAGGVAVAVADVADPGESLKAPRPNEFKKLAKTNPGSTWTLPPGVPRA